MKKIIVALAFLLLPVLVFGQVIPKMEFYHGKECPHCKNQHKWLPELEALYPDLEVEIYEVWHNESNRQRMQQRLAEIGATSNSVPTNIIEGDLIVGFNKDKILATLEKHYGPPSTPKITVEAATEDGGETSKDSWWGRFISWLKKLF